MRKVRRQFVFTNLKPIFSGKLEKNLRKSRLPKDLASKLTFKVSMDQNKYANSVDPYESILVLA